MSSSTCALSCEVETLAAAPPWLYRMSDFKFSRILCYLQVFATNLIFKEMCSDSYNGI